MTQFADDRERREAAAGFDDVFEQLTAAIASERERDRDRGAPAQLLAGVEQRIAAERGVGAWLRARPTLERALLATAAVLAGMVLGLLRPRADLPLYPKLRLVLELAVPLALIGLALVTWLRPLHKAAPRIDPTPWLLGLVLLLPIAQALLPAAHQGHAASGMGAGARLLAGALPCMLWGSAMGLPVGLLLRALGRGGGRVASRGAVLAGAVGGLAGLVALHLHCPVTHGGHLLLGHAPIPALAALLAVAVTLVRRRRRDAGASSPS